MIRMLSADDLSERLAEASRMLERAMLRHPFLTGRDALVMALAGFLRPVAVLEDDRLVGMALLEVVEYPRHRICNVFALAGEHGFRRKYVDALEAFVEEYARGIGCSGVMIASGRPGWKKLARNWRGSAVDSVLAYKEITRA